MRASELDWAELPNFSASEWPDGVLDHMDAQVVDVLQAIRRNTGPLHPSPVERAHVRHEESSSRHSTMGKARLSIATDVFCQWSDAPGVVTEALWSPTVWGIGVYDAMRFRGGEPGDWCMVHIDVRGESERSCWIARGRDPVQYETVQPIDLFRFVTEDKR